MKRLFGLVDTSAPDLVAKLFDVTAGRISQIRSQLQAAWEAYQGEESAVAWA